MTKENKPLVTIVVPIYNIAQYFDDCVQSIATQTYENLEVFLVAGMSPDNSIELAEEFSKKDKRFRYLSSEDNSLSGNRNTGLSQATGKYIMFIDGDDFISKDAVENMVNTIERDQSDVALGLFEQYKEYKDHADVIDNRLDPRVFEQGCRDKILRHLVKRKYAPSACRTMFSKSFLNENDLMFPKDTSMAEDMHFTTRVYTKADKISYYDGVIYHYRIREGSIIRSSLTASKVVTLLGVTTSLLEYSKTRTNKSERKYIRHQAFVATYVWLAFSAKLPKPEKIKVKAFIRGHKKQIRSILWKSKMVGIWTRMVGIIPGCASSYSAIRCVKNIFKRKKR